jgi:peptide/nickel transport system substrate-binding protein
VLRWLGLGGTASLAGCSSGDDSGGTDTGTGTTAADTTTAAAKTSTPTATPEDTTREVSGNYRTAVSSDAESLNWLTTADQTSGNYVAEVLDATWVIDPDQNIFPLWADISTDDSRVYTVTLRDNLRWGADYGQQTAEDWVYLIKNVFQAEGNWVGYPNADDWFAVNPDTGNREPIPVEKVGKLEFEIQLFGVDPAFPFKPVLWGQNCMPKELLEKYVPDKDAEGLKRDPEINEIAYGGNLGPYTYEEWQRESQYVTRRNDDYYLREVASEGGDDLWPDDVDPEPWANAPYFEQSTTRVIKEQAARLGALESGNIEAAGIPPDKAGTYKQNESVSLNVTPQPFVSVVAYNQRANGMGYRPGADNFPNLFRKKSFRQAMATAVDKRAIADSIYRGYAQVAQTMQPKWSKWYDDSQVTEFGVGDNYGKEPTLSLIEDAVEGTGYELDGDVLRNPNLQQVTLTLYFDQGQNTERTLAEFIAQELGRNAGIEVSLKSTSSFISKFAHNTLDEGATLPDDWEGETGYFNAGPREVATSPEPWDISVNLGFNTYPYTPTSSKGFFEYKGGINYYGYKPSEGVDIGALYEEAITADEEKRKSALAEAFGVISEEQPFGFATMSSDVVGYQDYVVGPIADFASGWNGQTWYFTESQN